MEAVYPPERYCSSERINFNDYFKSYQKEILKATESTTLDDFVKELAEEDITQSELDELKQISCCRSELPVEDAPEEIVNQSTEDGATKSLDNADKEKAVHDAFIRITHTPSDDVQVKEEDGSEFLVTVRVFFPQNYNFNKSSNNRYKYLKPSQEILLLGSNTLVDLRDKILCTQDVGYNINVDSLFKSNLKPSELYPSGFIFIDNTFYNDFRNEKAIDYSEVVRQWAKDTGIGEMKTGVMVETKIKDLMPRLGYPYVYQHQGKCEHVLTFTDARLTARSDLYYTYPLDTRIYTSCLQYCDICSRNKRTILCMKTLRMPHDNNFLCKRCFYAYNYVDGVKLDNFEAYHYFDKTCLF